MENSGIGSEGKTPAPEPFLNNDHFCHCSQVCALCSLHRRLLNRFLKRQPLCANGEADWQSELRMRRKEPVASLSRSDNRLIGTIRSTWCFEAREVLCSRKDWTRLNQLTQWSSTPHTPLQQCPTLTTTAMVLKDLDQWVLFKKHNSWYIPQKLKGNIRSSLLLRSLPSTSHLQRTFLYHPEDGCRGRPPSLPTLTCLIRFTDAVSRHTPAPFQQV